MKKGLFLVSIFLCVGMIASAQQKITLKNAMINIDTVYTKADSIHAYPYTEYVLQHMAKDSAISRLKIMKNIWYANGNTFTCQYSVMDSLLVFEGVKNIITDDRPPHVYDPNEKPLPDKMYGIQYVWIDKKGKLKISDENMVLSYEKPVAETHNALFPNGITGLRNWFSNNLDAYDFMNDKTRGHTSISFNIILKIDTRGYPTIADVQPKQSPEIVQKLSKTVLKMPHFIPATSKGVPQNTYLRIPFSIQIL